MNLTGTFTVVGLIGLAYLVGRWGRLSGEPFAAPEPRPGPAGGARTTTTVAPLIPPHAVGGHRAANWGRAGRDPHLARRHYEALASEVARERRLAEYEARATRSDAPVADDRTAEVVDLPARRHRQRA